ncbi:bifunctional riboflavin kinase/FAD synthetase [Chloroflexota bacterium]
MPKHIRSLHDIQLTKPAIVTIGVFDGVHLGHQQLVRQLVAEAQASDRTSVVLTFFPHPDVVLKGVAGRYYLNTPEEKAELLLDMGVDLVITHTFDEEVRQIRAAKFVEQLRKHLNMSALWVGSNFALGYKREGTIDFLREQGREYGFSVDSIELKTGVQGYVISSTRIREALATGAVEQVATWFNRSYRIGGAVVHGDHRGRTIGFPTANIETWEEQLLPAYGVYACRAYLGGAALPAVVNIGLQPTFEGSQLKVEAHLLDFGRDIYGETLHLEFVGMLRAEKRFNGLDELVAQINKDVAQARVMLVAPVPPQ